ncbi:hypothetical protein [Sphingomonas sp. Leaf4]|uniref:hypothetical protein n=1 Tax=Sphingomonas sp. Leaf4 TaxID=2876553 RepID=UPI001E4BF742|nr:hypothetical protein [Sphingomonas sp. Leaf4]
MADLDHDEDRSDLVVTLDELASICGVTPETMRKHLKAAPDDADWLLERGRAGVSYQILAAGAVDWWKAREQGGGEDAARRAVLAQWRQAALGDLADSENELTGKQRYEEFRAAQAELNYRMLIGELCRAAEVEDHTVNAVIELRRKLQQVGAAIRRQFNLSREVEDAIEAKIGEQLAAFVKKLGTDGEPGETDAEA